MRGTLLVIVLIFIAILGVLTVQDVINYGVTPLSVVAVMILGLFATGIVGALREPPRE
jgi:hypothetical protein